MRLLHRLRTRTAAFTHDLLMVPVAWLGAYWLRMNLGPVPEPILSQAFAVLPVPMLIQSVVLWYFGLYRGVWRFASLPDLVRILKAVFVGTALAGICIFFLTRMQDVPRSVFPLYALLLVVLLGGPRLVYRWTKEHRLYHGAGKRVLIVGAGRAGEMLVRDLLRDGALGYYPMAFVDDDSGKQGRDVHGVSVLGGCDDISDVVEQMAIDLILLAVPSATSRQMRRIVGLIEKANVPFRTLPRIQDLVSGRSVLKELREVSIEDLLGREPVSLDWGSISEGIAGKVILVSGGGGSIGSELCRQVARLNPATLVVLDNSEFNLYRIEMELAQRFSGLALQAVLGDVCDSAAIDCVLDEHRPDIVFHAAAYKHVPMLESRVREAVRNNVLGTRNLALCAVKYRSRAFILISTDKAVNPVNVMGASKRVAEILCQNLGRQQSSTCFITVRFGNVLDSAGSVVPLFRKQITAGGPVTVTHAEVKRYFMTIPEACQLIMQAAAMGKGGEVFVLDMGEPVKISYLAEQMIVLAGKTPGEDIDIVYTGLRPGEKLFEELFHEKECLRATGHKKILLARYRELDWRTIDVAINELVSACERYDEAALRGLLGALVPEFSGAGGSVPNNVIPMDKRKR